MSFVPKMLVACALLSGISSANAAQLFYAYDPAATSAATATNSAAAFNSFSAALTGVGTDTFDSYVDFAPPPQYTAVGNGITFTSNWAQPPATSPYPAPTLSSGLTGFYSTVLSGNNAGFVDSFHFNSPVQAFGVNILNIGDSGNSTTLSVTVDFNGSNSRVFDYASLLTFAGGGYNSTAFLGLIDAAPFNNVTLTRSGTGGGDVLGFNAISVSAVPEPGTWAMLGTAVSMAGVFGLRRRRQAVA